MKGRFVVMFREDRRSDNTKGRYWVKNKFFATKTPAIEYAESIAKSREPLVLLIVHEIKEED